MQLPIGSHPCEAQECRECNMLRRLVKTGLAGALEWTGANALIGSLTAQNLPLVIGYHAVVEDTAAHRGRSIPPNLISLKMLERHLDWLGRRYRFISLDELGARLEGGEPFEKPTVAITFDDGYAGVYHHAFPLLRRKGIPAGLFVVTDLIGTTRLSIYDKLYLLLTSAFSTEKANPGDVARLCTGLGLSLPASNKKNAFLCDPFLTMRVLFTAFPQKELNRVIDALEEVVRIDESSFQELHPLSWDMVSEMYRVGMTIGSHTKTHALLTNESWQRVSRETMESRLALERKLGARITHFAYPDGRFNAVVVRLVAEAGYRYGYTTCLRRDSAHPRLTIPRKFLWEKSCVDALGRFSSSIMSCHTHWIFDMLATCEHNHTWPGSDPGDASTSSEPTGEGPGELTAPTSSTEADVVPHALNL